MPTDASFEDVMAKIQAGDEDAAAVVFNRFVDRLIALASHQFAGRVRIKADPEDVVQSVYLSFFKRQRDEDRLYKLSDWDSLWALLASITIHKCLGRRHFWQRSKRALDREVATVADSEVLDWWKTVDRGPTPLQVTLFGDTLDQLLGKLSPLYRQVAELTLQGYTASEVSGQCDCSERTVGRALDRLRKLWREIESGE